MGANFEIEIISEKFISKTAVAAFLQNIGIHGELKRGAVISNWNYEHEHEIPLCDSAIEDAVLKGHIVSADGETPDGTAFGSMFYGNVDATFTSSIWFRLALRQELDGYHGKDQYDGALSAIANALSVFYSFSPILIAMGTEIGFDYKGSVPNAIAKSIGVQKWMVRQEDGRFIWKDGGSALP